MRKRDLKSRNNLAESILESTKRVRAQETVEAVSKETFWSEEVTNWGFSIYVSVLPCEQREILAQVSPRFVESFKKPTNLRGLGG